MAVTFKYVRADPDMGKKGRGCSEDITAGGCTAVCQPLMSRLPLTAFVQQLFFDYVAVTLTSNCDTLPGRLRSSHRLAVGCFAGVHNENVPSIFSVEARWRQQPN